MAMPATHTDWTVEMLDALPDDGQRYEIIDGELFVTPSPSDVHQYVVGALYARLLSVSAAARASLIQSSRRRTCDAKTDDETACSRTSSSSA